jgi:hypothetical protein
MARNFHVTLTLEDMKDTLYAIAIARTACTDDIERFKRTPENHPLKAAHDQQLKHAEGNRATLTRLWDGYSRVMRSEGYLADDRIPLATGRDRSAGR